MGLHAEIYRGGYDCEINLFHGKRMVTIVNADGPFEPSDDAEAAMLVPGNLPGTVNCVAALFDENTKQYQPLVGWWNDSQEGKHYRARIQDRALNVGCLWQWPMFGGTYVASSDSRFGRKCEEIVGARFYGAVTLHDRYEG